MRQAPPTRLWRALGSATVIDDERVARRAPTIDTIIYAMNANVSNWF
jgi:hypothetical protein